MPQTAYPELERFVRREVASGKYRSRDEVIAAGLRLLRERERKLAALRKKIQEGLDSLDRGEGIDIPDEAAHRAFFDDVVARGRRRLPKKRTGK